MQYLLLKFLGLMDWICNSLGVKTEYQFNYFYLKNINKVKKEIKSREAIREYKLQLYEEKKKEAYEELKKGEAELAQIKKNEVFE